MSNVQAIPTGYVGVVPHIVVKGAAQAIDFYKSALGAEEVVRMPMPGTDLLLHAEIQIGGNRVMLSEENPEWGSQGPTTLGGSPVTLHLYVEDVDAALERAVEAGAEVIMPCDNMFWGDRYCKFKDPFGHHWSLATHIADPSQEEMEKAIQEWASQSGG